MTRLNEGARVRFRVKRGRRTISINALKSESVRGSSELRAHYIERLKEAKKRKREHAKKNTDSEYLETLRKDFKAILENLRY